MSNFDKDNLLRPVKRTKLILRIAWFVIILNILIILADIHSGHIRDPAIEALLNQPTQEAIGGTIGYCIGCSSLSIIALILGLVAWLRRQDKHGRIVAVVAIISLGVSLWMAFLPTSESGQELLNRVTGQSDAKEAPSVLPAYEFTGQSSMRRDSPEYVSNKHGFSVEFPEEPIVTNVGPKVHYAALVEGEGVYSVIVTTYSRPLHTDAYLEAYLQGRLVLLGDRGKVIRSTEVLFLGHRALDYEYAEEAGSIRKYFKGVKFVAGEGKLTYTVSLACTEETRAIAYARYDDFVRSFRLREQH